LNYEYNNIIKNYIKVFKENMERYKILKTLGDGTYGSVVKGINK